MVKTPTLPLLLTSTFGNLRSLLLVDFLKRDKIDSLNPTPVSGKSTGAVKMYAESV